MTNDKTNQRRDFIKKVTLTALGSIAAPHVFATPLSTVFKDSTNAKTILFQGDSITDGGRSYDKDWNHIMGQSFPYLVAGRLWFDHPDQQMMFLNRGISGHTVRDLQARWQKDTLDLKPDILNILIGVNDVHHVIHNNNPTTVDQFRNDYDALLNQTKTALPDIKLLICEPFILPVGQVNADLKRWQDELTPRQLVAKQLAQKYNAVFVPLQTIFNAALKKAPAEFWIWDGVHPMPAGHELIAREWIKAAKKNYGFPG
ncbi:SGNH/GDSL hydrolase family protein [Mucilaginibacter ginsenosidivorax]|uniref:SGNH/GDSL hydrolase family protein n=1 Tax=Mucilaginibacter ginsenosidivorax TaxID=862126 RepID=A0A5B8VXK3_9SPHI|nr:SGNH/GDSL hydrolase family protein [Mucilaginibacter ginsenosidivorax]QEC75156.1 SGNH/GDSL hydrolase family protein [Mucilaginibacter ginsenosidivorax]